MPMAAFVTQAKHALPLPTMA